MNPELRNRLIKATAGGAIALATVLIQWHKGVRYTPYRDSGGVLSVCYGHTGSDIIPGKRYSAAECQSLLDSDLKAAMAVVDANVTVPLTESQKAALASFAYNVGSGAF
ncbi:putative phage lysozyme lysis protein [Sodalis glossinidius str. 'morsitans']|nr:putative phage lysozyme lysis protein [Sodalis glossinidius str. 'morsitans']